MLIHSLKLTSFLSFGPDSEPIELRPLNVLIGPNGSGKSNLVEAIGLLQAAPVELTLPISVGGGVRDWLWKGAEAVPTASLEAVIEPPGGTIPLRYRIAFTEKGHEAISKADVLRGLHNATRKARTKGSYSKGKHSLKILALIDPALVREASPHADRLLAALANPEDVC